MINFKRVKENFVCENCGFKVEGDGYTDHCPKCLWGKHVDESIPGDRNSNCGQLMEPVRTKYVKGEFKIDYQCNGCGHQFTVRTDKNDDRETLVNLINN